MPKFKPSILISDCWGSVGDLTFYHMVAAATTRRKAGVNSPGLTPRIASSMFTGGRWQLGGRWSIPFS